MTTAGGADPADTRSRLLRASLAVFARRDVDAVSVREIVDLAGVNIAAISYHFGGKQGLYLATARYLADTLRDGLDPTLARIPAGAARADRAVAGEMLREMVRLLVETLAVDRLSEDAAGFILREQHQPTAAFDILYERLIQPIHQTYQLLESRIVGDAASGGRRQDLITHALLGQILAFRSARTTVLRRLGQPDLGSRDAREIAEEISRLTLNALRHGRSEGNT